MRVPYCPMCNREYRRGKTQCPKCSVPLVEAPWEESAAGALGTAPTEGAEPEFDVVCETDSPVVLSRAKAILEAEDISSVTRWPLVTQPFAVVGDGRLVYDHPAWPRVSQLVVRAEDAARARAVLDSLEPIAADDAVDDSDS